jgi:hypothetical protein
MVLAKGMPASAKETFLSMHTDGCIAAVQTTLTKSVARGVRHAAVGFGSLGPSPAF